MHCHRCSGWMCRVWVNDSADWELMWKCLNCGHLVDAMIMINAHRLVQSTPQQRVVRRRSYET